MPITAVGPPSTRSVPLLLATGTAGRAQRRHLRRQDVTSGWFTEQAPLLRQSS